jgi:hypothetical protein
MMTKSSIQSLLLASMVLLAVGVALPVRAQEPDDLKRGVARISLMEGDVSVRRGDSGEWVAGVINAPLLTDDRIATGANSRAEVQFDSSNILRIGGNAAIHLAQLEAGRYHLEISRGTVTYRILHPSNASVELNTPSVSVRPAKEGSFRITVNEAGESEITARTGDVEVFTPKGSQWVYTGQTMMARGSATDPEFQMVNGIPVDDWDRWNDTRDRALLQSSNSDQYVPQGVYGAEDLDAAGTWVYAAPYGYVWRPTAVVAGWAPYRNGRWVWLDYYGWTWVSYDPWGWAPYHYGRWFFDVGVGWAWYPGVMGVRHYWSPALVGFFGYGGGIGVGVGFGFGYGNIGWVALAPYETLHPWWGAGIGVGLNRGINVSSVNISNIYRNARVVNGISGVSTQDFSAGRFQNVQRVTGAQVQQAGLVSGRVPINATIANRRFSDRAVANIPRSQANGGQGTAAQAASRAAANTQAQSAFHRFGEPGGNAATQNTRPSQAATPNSTAAQRQGSFQRFGEPGSSQSAPRNDRPPSAQGSTGGWKSFGTPGSSSAAPRQPYNPPQNRPRTGTSSSPANNAPRQAPGNTNTPARTAPSSSTPERSAPAPSPSSHPAAGRAGRSGSGGKGR